MLAFIGLIVFCIGMIAVILLMVHLYLSYQRDEKEWKIYLTRPWLISQEMASESLTPTMKAVRNAKTPKDLINS